MIQFTKHSFISHINGPFYDAPRALEIDHYMNPLMPRYAFFHAIKCSFNAKKMKKSVDKYDNKMNYFLQFFFLFNVREGLIFAHKTEDSAHRVFKLLQSSL